MINLSYTGPAGSREGYVYVSDADCMLDLSKTLFVPSRTVLHQELLQVQRRPLMLGISIMEQMLSLGIEDQNRPNLQYQSPYS